MAPPLPNPPPGNGAAPSPGRLQAADFDSLQQAADWFALLRADRVTEQDRKAWQAWLRERTEHATAWHHVEAVSQRFEPLRVGGGEAALAGAAAARKGVIKRRRLLGGGAIVLGTSLLGWQGWRHTPLRDQALALAADHATGTGERRDLLLTDGSRIWLNARSAMDVDYRDAARCLTLLAGEILIATAPDPARRPFYVESRFGRMQALGTRFSVRLAQDQVQLDVYDGEVAVRNRAGATVNVMAGGQARFNAERILSTERADPARQAWSRGVVLADNLPLKTLVNELGRYRKGYLGVAPEVADMLVMGVFPADDPDRALDLLERNLPVRVQRPLPWWTSIVAR
ncbi:FecR domain-containing protein [Achromobacter xylosoxidans]|uniref:FecR domain-containing protein n=1 Tax=Alcaligenes xylosoxydans xylosoxydans TaxID=85698 RepID=UPI001F1443CF|nr:FecR domain-containing protein [Achromobacter xylosoxidans]